MALTLGTRIGPYEITGALGAGGMGEVYRARDTNLGREAAIKVLPAAFTQDAEAVARLRREAQVRGRIFAVSISASGQEPVFIHRSEELKRIIATGGVR